MEKGRCNVWGGSGTGRKGEARGGERVRASRGANLPIWQEGVMASEFHLRAFGRPEACGMAHQVHSFQGAHWT